MGNISTSLHSRDIGNNCAPVPVDIAKKSQSKSFTSVTDFIQKTSATCLRLRFPTNSVCSTKQCSTKRCIDDVGCSELLRIAPMDGSKGERVKYTGYSKRNYTEIYFFFP